MRVKYQQCNAMPELNLLKETHGLKNSDGRLCVACMQSNTDTNKHIPSNYIHAKNLYLTLY